MMKDFPRFYMYDIARGAYLRPDSFCKILRHAAESGFTHFIPYLENMIELPSMQKAACSCAYTGEDWERFQSVAAECGIELVPHFNTIGHSNQICLVYPELTGSAAVDSAENQKLSSQYENLSDPSHFSEIDPTAPAAQKWMLQCLKEYCSFSRSEYFLIGGDEWNTPSHLLAQEGFDAGIAWCDFMNLAVEYLVSQNRTPIIWHDMLVHYPHILERLNKNAVIAFWFYDYDSGYPFLDTLKKYGFKTIMATGLCNGAMTSRRKKAFQCAMEECRKYHADGFMVTTWMDGRFERQCANLELSGALLDGKTIPPVYSGTLTDMLLLQRVRNELDQKDFIDRKTQFLQRLSDPAWEIFPEYRELLRNTAEQNIEELRKMYQIHHYPEGPFYSTFKPAAPRAVSPEKKAVLEPVPAGFGLELIQDPVTGNTIRFYNDGETFVIYPEYGARLQDWRTDRFRLIPNGLPEYLKKRPYQKHGSFRSFNSPGFMPMWDPGTHLNPNIIWQYPWEYRLDSSDPENPAVELYRKFSHAEITYRVSIRKGVSGFQWDLQAVNLLPYANASFGWNFCLEDKNVLDLEFITKSEKKRLLEFDTELPVLDHCSSLQLKSRDWCLDLEIPPEDSAGIWIDWGIGWLTPDLHGKYRAMEKGDLCRTQWKFSLKQTDPELV